VLWTKILYNKRSSKKLGWKPCWFNANKFNADLITKIKQFQKEHNLKEDGLCGSNTFRRILAKKEVKLEQAPNTIICEGAEVPIEWNKVVNLNEPHALQLPSRNYRRYKANKRKPSMIVTHYDVCLSAKSCFKVLKNRKISSHFVIDNDGTIFQMVDTQHSAWHAGIRRVNKAAIGIDISNAVYTKYQPWYRKKGFGPRPIMSGLKIHGVKLSDYLGFYPVQIEAYKVLVKTLCKHYNIPIQMPMDSNNKVLRGVSLTAKQSKFKGIVNHFHVSRKKIDVANLDWDQVLKELVE